MAAPQAQLLQQLLSTQLHAAVVIGVHLSVGKDV